MTPPSEQDFEQRAAALATLFVERGFTSVAAACADHRYGFVFFIDNPAARPPNDCLQETETALGRAISALLHAARSMPRGNGERH
jgi:hypothetical protein